MFGGKDMQKRPELQLVNGVVMPQVGFGTFKVEEGKQVVDAVCYALQAGYRHIDTAAVYGNESGVGAAILKSGLPRKAIFITSKVWNADQGYDQTLKAFERSLAKLGVEYLDLYLIHWPKTAAKTADTWRALEELYMNGKVRAIGVSNFKEHHLTTLFETARVKPMVNQVELHPQFSQAKLIEFCQQHDIIVQAWGPLMQGKVFDIAVLKELAIKYTKNVAQIVLRWHVQKGIAPLPKSLHQARIIANLAVFDFELSQADMQIIDALETGVRIGPDPDKINF